MLGEILPEVDECKIPDSRREDGLA